MNLNRYLTVTLLASLMTITGVMAQNSDDYVITLEGDTTRIEFKEWSHSYPPEILETKSGKTYRPDEIKGFSHKGFLYQSATAVVEVTERRYELRLDHKKLYNLDKDYDTVSAFMTVLVKGEATLLQWRYPDFKTIYFYSGPDTTLELRMTKEYKLVKNDRLDQERTTSFYYNKLYLNQLAYIMRSCSATVEISERIRYEKRDLVRVFERYNMCLDPSFRNKMKQDKAELYLGVRAGANIATVDYIHNTRELAQADYETSIQPYYAVYFRVPGFVKGLFFELDFSYNALSTSGTYQESDFFYEDTYYSDLSVENYRGGLSLRYHYPVYKDFKPYVLIGGGVGFAATSDQRIDRYRLNTFRNEATYTIKYIDNKYTATDMIFDFSAGFGIQWKRWALDYRWMKPGPYLDHLESKQNVNHHILTLSFDIISQK
ncbi:MAG: hypothetical protein ACPF9D_10550 [Owenweeksia sp.]